MSIATLRAVSVLRRLQRHEGAGDALSSGMLLLGQRLAMQSMSTFVSKHFAVDEKEISEIIGKMNTQSRTRPDGQIEVKECSLCDKPNKSKADNLWKLNVRPDGSFYCFRCSHGGNWFQLKRAVVLGQSVCASGKGSQSSSHSTSSGVLSGNTVLAEILDSSEKNSPNNNDGGDSSLVLPDQDEARGYSSRLYPLLAELSSDSPGSANDNSELDIYDSDVIKVRKYLTEVRGLTKNVLMRYGVGISSKQFPVSKESTTDKKSDTIWEDKVCMTFPWIRPSPESVASSSLNSTDTGSKSFVIERIKFRALDGKGLQRLVPKGGSFGMFGWHLVKPWQKTIVITEGEFDAMAVAQSLWSLPENHPLSQIPAVSLPNGCSSLPLELLPRLESFTRIYLWLDNDKPGQEGAEKMAKKLGRQRCYIVRPDPNMKNPPKDANDALRMGIPGLIPSMISSASRISHQNLVRFPNLKDKVLRFLKSGPHLEGIQTSSFPQLSAICKGFRRGELVIFTGPTGSGKTTFLSQLSLDFARQGSPVLWGSFEIQNYRLVSKMLFQHYGSKYIETALDSPIVDDFLVDFENLPLSFLNYYGGTPINEVLEVIDVAIYQHDISHVIIDNLQFMMPRGTTTNGNNIEKYERTTFLDRYESQDVVLDKFRKFATEKNINIIIVIHPRKVDDGTPLTMSSISGTAKATQEADIVLLLQRLNGRTSVEVKKNRFDGELGSVELGWMKDRNAYFEMAPGNQDQNGSPSSSSGGGFRKNPAKIPVNDVDLPL